MKVLYSGFDLCDPATSVSMTINGPAPTGGSVVPITVNQAAVTGTSVTIPAGSTSANFTLTTVPVADSVTVTATATLGGTATDTADVLMPTLTMVLSSKSIKGGQSVLVKFNLDSPAPAGFKWIIGAPTPLHSPVANITFVAGTQQVEVTITSDPVTVITTKNITAKRTGTAGTITVSKKVTINP